MMATGISFLARRAAGISGGSRLIRILLSQGAVATAGSPIFWWIARRISLAAIPTAAATFRRLRLG